MSKHTKGPWFKNEYRQILGASAERRVGSSPTMRTIEGE